MKKLLDEIRLKVKEELEKDNSTYEEIAEKFNIGYSTVKGIKKEFNIQRTYQKPTSKETKEKLSQKSKRANLIKREQKFKEKYTEEQILNAIDLLKKGGQTIRNISKETKITVGDLNLIRNKKIFSELTEGYTFNKELYKSKIIINNKYNEIEYIKSNPDILNSILNDLKTCSNEAVKRKYQLQKRTASKLREEYNIIKKTENQIIEETKYDEIILYLKSNSIYNTAEHFNLPRKNIAKIYQENNIKEYKNNNKEKITFSKKEGKYTEEQVKQTINLLLQQKSVKEISKIVNLPTYYIYRIKNKNCPKWEYLYKDLKFEESYKLICKNCGKEFEAKDPKTLYCSRQCKKEYMNTLHEHEVICECCGKSFTTIYPNVKYCSTSCGAKVNAKLMGFGSKIRPKEMWNKGLNTPEEIKLKISDGNTRAIIEGRKNHKNGNYKANFREDLNQFFRSSYEANIARYYNYKNIKWEFEKHRIFLKNLNRYYVPDFYLPDLDLFVEVKGLYRKDSKDKFDAAKNQGENIIMLDILRYSDLDHKYRNIIPNWEQQIQIPDEITII